MEQKENIHVIEASLIEKEGIPPVQGKIVKISPLGFLFQMIGTSKLLIGDQAMIQFKLPSAETQFNESVKVMKAYLRWAEPKAGQGYSSDIKSNLKVQLLEFHFLQITPHRKGLIETFLEQTAPKE